MRIKILLYLLLSSQCAVAQDFIEDTQTSLSTRNYYYDRNYTEQSNVSALKEWAQGFILNVESGYTPGPIGLGVDIQAMAGFKLYADDLQTGAQLLPVNKSTREAADAYGEIGVTAKVKYSETELKVGSLMPFTPVLFASRARLLPQVYRGAELKSKDLSQSLITAGWLNKVNHRDSTDYEDIRITGANGKFIGAPTDNVFYAGIEYNVDKKNLVGAYAAKVEDLYQQTVIMAKTEHELNENFIIVMKMEKNMQVMWTTRWLQQISASNMIFTNFHLVF